MTPRIFIPFTWYEHVSAKQRTHIRYHMLECGAPHVRTRPWSREEAETAVCRLLRRRRGVIDAHAQIICVHTEHPHTHTSTDRPAPRGRVWHSNSRAACHVPPRHPRPSRLPPPAHFSSLKTAWLHAVCCSGVTALLLRCRAPTRRAELIVDRTWLPLLRDPPRNPDTPPVAYALRVLVRKSSAPVWPGRVDR